MAKRSWTYLVVAHRPAARGVVEPNPYLVALSGENSFATIARGLAGDNTMRGALVRLSEHPDLDPIGEAQSWTVAVSHRDGRVVADLGLLLPKTDTRLVGEFPTLAAAVRAAAAVIEGGGPDSGPVIHLGRSPALDRLAERIVPGGPLCPRVASTSPEGGLTLVSGSYPTDRPLPIVGDVLTTDRGPIRVGGQVMTADGPVVLPPSPPRTGTYPRVVSYGAIKATEHDPNPPRFTVPPGLANRDD